MEPRHELGELLFLGEEAHRGRGHAGEEEPWLEASSRLQGPLDEVGMIREVVRDQGNYRATAGHPQLGLVAHGRQQGRVDLREPVFSVQSQIGAARSGLQHLEGGTEAVADLERRLRLQVSEQ